MQRRASPGHAHVACGWVGPKPARRVERAIRTRLAAGTGILKTAKALGVGTSVVQRIKATLA
jgi:hypothetical protein